MKYTTTTYADGVPYTSAETDSLPEPTPDTPALSGSTIVTIVSEDRAESRFVGSDGTVYTQITERIEK